MRNKMIRKRKNHRANPVSAKELQDPNKFITSQLDVDGISDYIKLLRSPFKMFWLNVFIGVARGLGFTVGTAVVLAVLYKVIRHMIEMNIPYLTEMLREFLETVQPVVGGGTPGF